MNWRPVIIIAFAVACLRASAGTPSADVPDIPDVRFPEGQPMATGNFEPSSELLTSINGALEAFNRFPTMNVNIVGHTDSKECAGTACADLGLRRAQYVYDWLDLHGVDRKHLGTVLSVGSATPVLSSESEDRRLSRRVSFDVLPESNRPNGGKP
jgi:outer membrane protein OmpA-like peptidoglycan-associated protein